MSDLQLKVKNAWGSWLPWILVFIVGGFTLFFRIGHESLWYDESYTAIAIQHPIGAMIQMIGNDSHPPLYFIMLNLYARVFGYSVIAIRSFSALGILALGALGLFPLQKIVERKSALIYSLLCFLTPLAVVQGQEARMYGWTAFWITGAFLFAVLLFRENKIKHWILFGAFSLAAAYTHYYGFIAAGCINLVLLIALIVNKRELLWRYLIQALALLAAYSPWFVKIYGQASRVTENYWINDVTLNLIGRILGYPFSSNGVLVPPQVLLAGVVLTAGILLSIVWGLVKKKKNIEIQVAAYAVFIMTLLSAVLISAIIRPILVERYMTSCLGLLILCITLGITRFEKRWAGILSFSLYGLVSLMFLIPAYVFSFKGPMNEVVESLEKEVTSKDIFVHGSEHTMGVFSYYFPENFHYLYIPEGYVAFSNYDIFTNNGDYGSDYFRFMNSRNPVWVTNTPVEHYRLPLEDFVKSDHLLQVGSTGQYTKLPGWFQLTATKFEYVDVKTADQYLSKVARIEILVEGIEDLSKSNMIFSIHGPGELGVETMIKAGGPEIDVDNGTVIIPDVPFGEIVIVLFDDLNGNMRPDFASNGMPLDGFGFVHALDETETENESGFDELKITVDQQDMQVKLTMEYPE